MTTDWKALCAELLHALESEGYAHWVITPDEDELCLRARAALAQPEPEGPASGELRQIFNDHSGYIDDEQVMWCGDFCTAARAVLARWGNHPGSPDSSGNLKAGLTGSPAAGEVAEPVPVAERLPGPGDCDALP